MQDDFFLLQLVHVLAGQFPAAWEAIFAVLDLARILVYISAVSTGFVPMDEMNSVSLFHFESLTSCHFCRHEGILYP